MLEAGLSEHAHEVAFLAGSSSPLRAGPGLLFRRPFVAARARQADLVHLHGDMTAILSRQLVGPKPSVITTHGLHFVRRAEGRVGERARRALAGAAERAGAVLCTSQAELDDLRAIAGDGASLLLAPNGVSLAPAVGEEERRAKREELGLGPGEVTALFAGELSERKDPLAAARAAAGAGIVLLVAGEGPLRSALAVLEGPAVRLLGFRDDLPALLGAADLFVLPSSREGLSLALLEAMAAGLPPVVADGPGNPEAVGEAGLVVPAGDEAALTAALARLAGDGEERARLGEAARDRVGRHFTPEAMLARAREAYAAELGRTATA